MARERLRPHLIPTAYEDESGGASEEDDRYSEIDTGEESDHFSDSEISISGTNADFDGRTVKVLVLEFAFNDLDLEAERRDVIQTFHRLGYVTELFKIRTLESPTVRSYMMGKLRSFLIPTVSRDQLKEIVREFLSPENPQRDLTKLPRTLLRSNFDRGHVKRHLDIYLKRAVERRLKTKLQKFLNPSSPDNGLFIVYYHGHGGMEEIHRSAVPLQTFLIFSHNQVSEERDNAIWEGILEDLDTREVQRVMSDSFHDKLRNLKDWRRMRPIQVGWKQVCGPILEAQKDVLVILDCCNAGMAATTMRRELDLNRRSQYRKELIGACSWRLATRNLMSKAMTSSLENTRSEGRRSISTLTLVSEMDQWLAIRMAEGNGQDPHQPLHSVIQTPRHDNNRSNMIILPIS
ncbi:hypothetical protein TWF718_002844 [Orbilia javanica]|uniref:Uncharacterized protein n=1 Tax=Orbilia javanica TaxID=47235 RepID=A0AAN8RBL6_9PEZI